MDKATRALAAALEISFHGCLRAHSTGNYAGWVLEPSADERSVPINNRSPHFSSARELSFRRLFARFLALPSSEYKAISELWDGNENGSAAKSSRDFDRILNERIFAEWILINFLIKTAESE